MKSVLLGGRNLIEKLHSTVRMQELNFLGKLQSAGKATADDQMDHRNQSG